MRSPEGSSSNPRRRRGSLSLRLGAVFVTLLIAAAAAVGFLFDRGRADALARRDLEQLRFQVERGADEVDDLLRRLGDDVQLLARTSPIQEILRALQEAAHDPGAESSLEPWKEQLGHLFLLFASARPDYLAIRFLRISDGVRELVGVERGDRGQEAVPSTGYSGAIPDIDPPPRAAQGPGLVRFSRFDLDRGLPRSEAPARVSLSASTPVLGADGDLGGLLLVRMDLGRAFERARALAQGEGSLVIGDADGGLLFQAEGDPESALKAQASLARAREQAEAGRPVAQPGSENGVLGSSPGGSGEGLVYLTERRWDPEDPRRRLIFVLAQSRASPTPGLAALRRDSLVGLVVLLALATLLVGLLVRGQTRPLVALAGAAEAIAQGDFKMDLPAPEGGEVGSLIRAFRHMAREVERREQDLAALNLELEGRVEARTRELASEHALQRLILDGVGDGVVVVDPGGRFVLWNRKAEQIVGAGPADVPAARWSEHFGIYRDESGEPVPSQELPLVRALRGESTESIELYLRNPKGGEGRWAQVTARPLRDPDGGLAGAVAVMVDVTERRRLEAGIQAHRAELGRYARLFLGAEIASTTAHQLSQPLGALCNYAGAALRLHQQGRLGGSDLSEMLERIERLSVEAGAILDRLRARIRRSETPPTPIDVDSVVRSCLDSLGDRIRREGVRLVHRPATGLPVILGDPLELEHALIQLVANALEAMEGVDRRERRLTLTTGHDPAAGQVTLEIADTGPGVSAELADRLFRPWETDKPGALGIGLSIVQSVIESFGGQVRMEPELSGGTRVRIELPVAGGGRR